VPLPKRCHNAWRSEWEVYLNNAAGPCVAAMDRMQFNCGGMLRVGLHSSIWRKGSVQWRGRIGGAHCGAIVRSHNTLIIRYALNLRQSYAGNTRIIAQSVSLQMLLRSVQRHGYQLGGDACAAVSHSTSLAK
jgi:hypothetical protein